MTLEESIAKFNLGELSMSQFPEIAIRLVENGIESESLLILAGMNSRDNSFEIKQYLNSTIAELKIRSFKSLEAAYVLANSYVKKVNNRELNIIKGILKIKNECWDNCKNDIESKIYLYDGIKFERIIGLWYEYHEVDEQKKWIKESGESASEIKLQIEKDLHDELQKWKKKFINSKLEQISKLI